MSSLAIRRAAPANPVVAAVNTAQVFSLLSNALVPATVVAPGKLVLEAKSFKLRAEGNYSAAGAYTLKASLLGAVAIPAVPLTAANWTLLGAGTARAIGAAGFSNWWIEANLIFDSDSGLLNGTFNQMVNNLYDAAAAIANQVTGINGTNVSKTQAGTVVPQTDPAVYFAVALTFGTANAANVGNLVNFEVGF